MDLRHFRYFIAVAEELHFGKAAEKMHIAQPALSIQIKTLEQALGGQLFHRTSRKVILTEAGKLFLREARQVLESYDKAIKLTQKALKGEAGLLNIGYSGSVAYSGILGHAVQAFREIKPAFEFQLTELDPYTQLSRLLSRDIDLGLMPTFSLQVPKQISTLRLAAWPSCVVLSDKHPLAKCSKLSTGALAGEDFIVYAGSDMDDGASGLRRILSFEPKVAHKASNMMMVLSLVSAGMGVSIVPASVKQSLKQPGLTFKVLDDMNLKIDISLVYRNDIPEPAVSGFIECIQTLPLLGSTGA
jgi:DNA-binding transcriptional LysR family regulator